MERFACRRCHTVGRQGNRLAANLDTARSSISVENMDKALSTPAFYMPVFGFTPDQRADIITALLATEQPAAPPRDQATIVHFADAAHTATDLFTRQCGSCHKILSPQIGGAGRSDIGPNLSGLLTPHYPRTLPGNTAWNPKNLAQWLDNPRRFRKASLMRPVRLTPPEFRQLLQVMADHSAFQPVNDHVKRVTTFPAPS
jgi:cytochrome c2